MPHHCNMCSTWQNFLSNKTARLDIAFSVSVVSIFLSNPRKKHWEVVKMILRYLSGTKNKCLCLGGGNVFIMGYTDSECWLSTYRNLAG